MLLAMLTAVSLLGMDYSSNKMKEIEPYIKDVYKDATKNEKIFPLIAEASKFILDSLATWPEAIVVPEKLIKAAAVAIGQFCYFSPYSIQFLEHAVLPYLQNGRLTYEDFKTPHCAYQFGLKYS